MCQFSTHRSVLIDLKQAKNVVQFEIKMVIQLHLATNAAMLKTEMRFKAQKKQVDLVICSKEK